MATERVQRSLSGNRLTGSGQSDTLSRTIPVTDAQIRGAIDRLRRELDLERNIAAVRHQQVQWRVIYGERLTDAAKSLLEVLSAG